jgi:hypothetical protein
MPLQIRRGTEIERENMAQPLAQGELLYTTDNRILYVGDGTTLGGVQITGYRDEDAQDAAAAMITSGIHSGINFVYNDLSNRIDATVNLSNYTGIIRADAFKGSVFADDGSTIGGTLLVDAVDGKINLDGTVKGNIIPSVNETYDIGSASLRFRDLYLSGSSIKLGDATITATGSAVNLPAGSLVGGVPIGSGSGDGVISGSNYNINIVGDDSAVIVNSSTRRLTGELSGNILTTSNTRAYDQDLNVFFANGIEFVGGSTITAQSGTLDIGIADIGITTNLFNITRDTYSGTSPWVQLSQFHSVADAENLTFTRGRGTLNAPATVQTNDDIIDIAFSAYDGTAFRIAGAITAVVTGSVSNNIVPTTLSFQTHGTTAASNAARMTIDSTSVSFISPPKVPVFVDATARDAAITSPSAGMLCFISGTGKFQGNTDSTAGGWADLN